MRARIPVRFQRVAAAFDEGARVRLCESSGNEHSAAAESFADLSDLVKSFFERGNYGRDSRDDAKEIERDILEINEELEGGYWSDSETKNTLKGLLDKNNGGDGLLWVPRALLWVEMWNGDVAMAMRSKLQTNGGEEREEQSGEE